MSNTDPKLAAIKNQLEAAKMDKWMLLILGLVTGLVVGLVVMGLSYHSWFCANYLGYWVCQ